MFYDNLNAICRQKKTTPTAVVKELGLSTSKITAWKNGSLPKQDVLKLLAEKLNTSVDCFFVEKVDNSKRITNNVTGDHNIVGENSNVNVSAGLSAQETELISIFRKLSEINKGKYLYQMSMEVEK